MLLDFKKVLSDFNIKPRGIIHTGAWSGEEFQTYLDCGIDNVVFIEAQEEPFNTLRDRVARYPNMKAIKACVSDKEGTTDFYVASNSQSSSMLEPKFHLSIHKEITFPEKITLQTDTLINIFAKEGLSFSDFDFLNCDVQGAEMLVLKGMGDNIKHFVGLYLEANKIPVYSGCCLVTDLDNYLAGYNFKRVLTGDWVKDAWTDCFYKK